MIWTKDITNFDWWEVELTFRSHNINIKYLRMFNKIFLTKEEVLSCMFFFFVFFMLKLDKPLIDKEIIDNLF